MKTVHYQTIEIEVEIEEPHHYEKAKCANFRLGQLHRKKGLGCLSANGAYLDGWYSPEKEIPPYVTRVQAEAFNLFAQK